MRHYHMCLDAQWSWARTEPPTADLFCQPLANLAFRGRWWGNRTGSQDSLLQPSLAPDNLPGRVWGKAGQGRKRPPIWIRGLL